MDNGSPSSVSNEIKTVGVSKLVLSTGFIISPRITSSLSIVKS